MSILKKTLRMLGSWYSMFASGMLVFFIGIIMIFEHENSTNIDEYSILSLITGIFLMVWAVVVERKRINPLEPGTGP